MQNHTTLRLPTDILNYIPGTNLEMREALNDPAYQVVGIRVGNALIADRCLLKMISCDDINRNSKEVGKAEEKDALNEILKNSIIKTCESAKLCKDFGISLWEKYLSAATGSPLMLQDASGAIKDLILSGMTYADDSLSFDELEAMTPKKFVELVIETAIESFNDAISTWRNEKTQ